METKKCRTCGDEKNRDHFGDYEWKKNRSPCLKCATAATGNGKELIKNEPATQREWARKNYDRCKAQTQQWLKTTPNARRS